jgi:hypothetical protein
MTRTSDKVKEYTNTAVDTEPESQKIQTDRRRGFRRSPSTRER